MYVISLHIHLVSHGGPTDGGIRYGHLYAYISVDTLKPKVDVDDDLGRISLVHYNTIDEVDLLVKALDEAGPSTISPTLLASNNI